MRACNDEVSNRLHLAEATSAIARRHVTTVSTPCKDALRTLRSSVRMIGPRCSPVDLLGGGLAKSHIVCAHSSGILASMLRTSSTGTAGDQKKPWPSGQSRL